jgi:lysophospholipid acyltransferase (LPLAT)-like uncharacterized protein
MKLRNPRLIQGAGRLGAWTIRLWLGTLRFEYHPLGPAVDPRGFDSAERRYLYAFWHETMLLPTYLYRHANCCILVSRHADGELITQMCRHLDIKVVRGSTTRGGMEAVRQMLAVEDNYHLAITPDGPRGPRRRVQMGVVYLAARLGLPIVPAGFGFDRPWRLRTWDRFALPKPGTRATCVTGVPIEVPSRANRQMFEAHRKKVEDELLTLTSLAERWAVEGRREVLREVAWQANVRKMAG